MQILIATIMLFFLILCTIFCPVLPLCPILLCPILQTLQFMLHTHRSNVSFRDTLQISFLILSEFKRVIIRFLLTSKVNRSSLIRSILFSLFKVSFHWNFGLPTYFGSCSGLPHGVAPFSVLRLKF